MGLYRGKLCWPMAMVVVGPNMTLSAVQIINKHKTLSLAHRLTKQDTKGIRSSLPMQQIEEAEDRECAGPLQNTVEEGHICNVPHGFF